MGSSASKATSSAKSAARHFPSANVIQERATNAAVSATTTSGKTSAARAAATSSPKQDYLENQKRLEEELAKYDEQLKKSGKLGMIRFNILGEPPQNEASIAEGVSIDN